MVKRFNISLPDDLVKKLDEVAQGSSMDRSEYIRMLIRNDLVPQLKSTTSTIEGEKMQDVLSRVLPLEVSPKESRVLRTITQAKEVVRSFGGVCKHGAARGLCKHTECK